MSQITIEKVVTENAFELLREEWKQLFAATGCSPFLSWEWLSTWYKSFGANRGLFILRICREDELIGLLPLCSQNKKVFGMNFKQLGFIGEETGGADYLDLIVKTGDKAEILPVIFDFLKQENYFDSICLESLSSDSSTVGFLRNFGGKTKRRLRHVARTTEICPRINLAGGWETILKQSKRASNFKRRRKQLEKMPGFEFRSVTSPAETAAAFERFYRLHEKRWSKQGGSELSGHARLVSFQRELVQTLGKSGLLRFDELWVEGECRASVYGLDDGRAFYYYNSGYDLEWANFSVGLVLIGLSVEAAIERGNTIYDFLRGNETYKFDWANEETELVTVSLNRGTLPALAHEAKNLAWVYLREISKKTLPADFIGKLKNRRRERKRAYRLTDLKVEKTQEVL